MTDTTQGQDAPNENALFNEATSTETLADFENVKPVTPTEKPAIPEKTADPKDKPADENAQVPAGRLREESERARKAERERDELRSRLEATARPVPREAPKPIELLDDPRQFVRQEVQPFLEQIQNDFQRRNEQMSLDWAVQKHGPEKVDAAYQAMRNGILRGDPDVKAAYERVMLSHDPYGQIVRWHHEGETLRTIGGDLDGYKKRILEEAMADPEYRAKVIEAAKGQAAAAGNSVARPVKPAVASSPSLGNLGAGGGDQHVIEPSDDELFRAATHAKRR